MSDIFVSYANQDRVKAKTLAQFLENEGWSAFWDRTIPLGMAWDNYIEKELNEARCLVVLWSHSSIDSGWVKEEAEEGKRRGILLPILIERVRPPLGFRGIQAADLSDWGGTQATFEFQGLVSHIARILGTLPRKAAEQQCHRADKAEDRKQAEAEAKRRKASVAVLPFDDLSAEQNLGYLGDGVAEDIITALSRFPDVVVIARGSSFAYKGKAVDIRQIGQNLGVDYVVEGSVRKGGDKLRIVSQLIDTKNGEHVWAERFDRSGADPWRLQDEVTGMIVSAITGETGALKQAQYREAWVKGAATLEEYDYYLRGHAQYVKGVQGDREGIERSGEIWSEGLSKFPSSTLLKVKFGWYHLTRAVNLFSNDPSADYREAGNLARQVLAEEHLSPQVARLANWLMSCVLVNERDFDGALAAVNKAVALAPYDTFMLSRLMMVLLQAGRTDQALQWADQVAARDPALSWLYNQRRGWAYLVLERFAEAAQALTQTEFNDAHLLLAIAYLRLGRLTDARSEVEKMLKINRAITVRTWRLGYSFRDSAILDRYALDLVQAGLPKE
jgi:TolB-like protein